TAIRLEVGESKILSAEDLSCLQLSSAAEDYLLSVGSFSSEKAVDLAMRLRSVGATAEARHSVVRARSPEEMSREMTSHLEGPHGELQARVAASLPARADAPRMPFDDYAGAAVGDTLEFVDWSRMESLL